jgi:membrane associated rhomboid family serine protease
MLTGMTNSARKPGNNAIKTGIVLLLAGGLYVWATISTPSGVGGVAVFVAVAGLVTLLVGIGIRREAAAKR